MHPVTFLLPFVMPASFAVAVALGGHSWWIVPFVAFGAIPALDAILGDETNETARTLVEETDEKEIAADDSNNIYALIQKMSVFQKIRLGRLGNKEARGLLVRERNKLVAIAALTSRTSTPSATVSMAAARPAAEASIIL